MRTELVATLRRRATELLGELERDKKPILIAQHGLPSAYLVDVETYELERQRMSVLDGIARGELAAAEGRTVTHARAKSRLVRWRPARLRATATSSPRAEAKVKSRSKKR